MNDLFPSLGNTDGEKSGHFWGVEIVQCCVNVPTVEAGIFQILLFWNGVFVESAMVGVFECDVLQTFV